jgi:hypothetical protein
MNPMDNSRIHAMHQSINGSPVRCGLFLLQLWTVGCKTSAASEQTGLFLRSHKRSMPRVGLDRSGYSQQSAMQSTDGNRPKLRKAAREGHNNYLMSLQQQRLARNHRVMWISWF